MRSMSEPCTTSAMAESFKVLAEHLLDEEEDARRRRRARLHSSSSSSSCIPTKARVRQRGVPLTRPPSPIARSGVNRATCRLVVRQRSVSYGSVNPGSAQRANVHLHKALVVEALWRGDNWQLLKSAMRTRPAGRSGRADADELYRAAQTGLEDRLSPIIDPGPPVDHPGAGRRPRGTFLRYAPRGTCRGT